MLEKMWGSKDLPGEWDTATNCRLCPDKMKSYEGFALNCATSANGDFLPSNRSI